MTAFSVGQGVAMAVGRGLTQAGAGGGAFVPDSAFFAGSAGASYDFSDASKLFVNSARTIQVTTAGDLIGSATDLSGNGNHASQATGASRFVWRGLYAETDGVDDSLATSAINFSSTDKMTVIVGLRVVGTATQGLLATSVGGSNGTFSLRYLAGASPSPSGRLVNNGVASTVNASGIVANSANAVHSLLLDNAGASESDEVKVRVNGALPTQFPQGTGPVGGGNFSASQSLYVGTYNGVFFSGRIYRVIVIGRTLSAGELASCEAWCNATTGAY